MRSDARKAMQEKRLAEQQVACPICPRPSCDCRARLAAVVTHTRTSTGGFGPDYCSECSEAVSEWVPWPCAEQQVAASGGVDELAGLLGEHRYRDVLGDYEIAPYYRHFGCSCGWEQDIAGMNGWRSWAAAHAAHVAEVIAREWLPERRGHSSAGAGHDRMTAAEIQERYDLRKEVERLTRERDEAIERIRRAKDVWERDRDAAEQAETEVERLRGVVARVEALAEEWEAVGYADLRERLAAELRNALRGADA